MSVKLSDIVEFLEHFLEIRAVNLSGFPYGFAVSDSAAEAVHAVSHKNFARVRVNIESVNDNSIRSNFFIHFYLLLPLLFRFR